MIIALMVTARAVAGLLLSGLLLCVCAGVVSRYVFNAPLTFTDEIAGYLFAASTLLGMAVTAFHGGHIHIDMMLDRFLGKARRRIERTHRTLSVVYVAILFVSGTSFFLNAFSKGLRAPTVLQTPVALVGILFPIAMALFLAERVCAVWVESAREPSELERLGGDAGSPR